MGREPSLGLNGEDSEDARAGNKLTEDIDLVGVLEVASHTVKVEGDSMLGRCL
jgi:hypothetical protein